jgi:hypothetical protein
MGPTKKHSAEADQFGNTAVMPIDDCRPQSASISPTRNLEMALPRTRLAGLLLVATVLPARLAIHSRQ